MMSSVCWSRGTSLFRINSFIPHNMSTPAIQKKKRVVNKIRLSLLKKWLVDNDRVESVFDLPDIAQGDDGLIDFQAVKDDSLFRGLTRSDLQAPKGQWDQILAYEKGVNTISQKGGRYASLFSIPYIVERLCQQVLGPRYEDTLVEWLSDVPSLEDPESIEDVDEADLEDVEILDV